MARKLASKLFRAAVTAAIVGAAAIGSAVAYEFGSIGVYTDATGSNCTVVDIEGLVEAYVVLIDSDGAAQVSFAIAESADLKMTYLEGPSEIHFPLNLGDIHAGIQVTFGACLPGPVRIATLVYSGTGTTSPCEAIRVVPHPGVGAVQVYDCAQNSATAPRGGMALVSNDGGCICNVATEPTTWGRVKALYQ